MKISSVVFVFLLMVFSGCSDSEIVEEKGTTIESTNETLGPADDAIDEGTNAKTHAHYRCPSDCEKGLVYHEARECPVCGKTMEKLQEN